VLETTGGKTSVAVAWMRFGSSIGSRDPRADAVFDSKAESVALANRRAAMVRHGPDGAHFVAAVSAPCKVDLRARASGDASWGLLMRTARGSISRRWRVASSR
jgi:hypothetical protein